MKTILTTLPDDKAQQELVRFARLGIASTVVGLVVFPVLGTIGAAFGARALLLTFHKGNKANPRLLLYRVALAVSFVLAWVELLFALYGHRFISLWF